jgi:hypothetical protein
VGPINRVLSYVYGTKGTTATSVTASCTYYVSNLQLENKSFATSYTSSSRGNGSLSYSANCIDPSKGTISFWYNPQYSPSIVTTQQNSPVMIQVGTYYGNSSFTIWNFDNTLKVHIKGATNSSWSAILDYTWSSQFAQNTWINISVTWSGLNWYLYVNGSKVHSINSTEVLGAIAGNTIYIGGANGGAGTLGNGLFEEVLISKKCYSDAEIKAIYDNQSPLYDPFPQINPPIPTNVTITMV